MKKTDFEIAAEAIQYCKAKLKYYYDLIDNYERNINAKPPSEQVYHSWQFEAARLEYILDIREDRPIYKDFIER